MNALSIAAQLGLAPLPPAAHKSRAHLSRQHAASRLLSCNDPAARVAAAERRESIVELCRVEPLTVTELMDALDATRDTIIEDVRMLIKAERLCAKMHKAENLYWVPQ